MTAAEFECLPDGEVHLWLTPLNQVKGETLVVRYVGLLSSEELALQQRFHFARDRHRYLVTRALVRTVLSRYSRVAPRDWVFGSTPYGRPTIVSPLPFAETITFNISHSNELVVCAVRRGGALGVDTEHLRRDVSLSIASRYFSAEEVRDMEELPLCQQPERFLEVWTLKESYIKARGMGLSMPLDQFGFRFPSPGRIAAFFNQGDTPARWMLWQLRFERDHLISLCTENDRPVTLVTRQIVPLQLAQKLDLHVLRSSTQSRQLPKSA